MDGAGDAGTATTYARGDHQHPSDTSRMPATADGTDIPVGGLGPWASSNIETAISDLYNDKADIDSPIFTGTPSAPTPQAGDNSTLLANTEFVHGEVGDRAKSTSLAPAFSASSTYAVGDYVTREGLLYKCTTAVSTAGAWNAANWSPVAAMSEMPAPITVDSAMSTTSTNPVQNKVVNTAIDGKISWDNLDKNSATIGNRQAYINHGIYSLVVGDNAAATGYQCVAIGFGVGTSGNNSVVIGWWSSAGGNSALSIGQNTNAVARGSIAAGKRATASTGDWGTGTAHEYAFVWQGGGSVAPSNNPSVGGGYYHSHDEGTFNINPKPASGSTDPATGFWIGEKKLPEVIAENTNYLAYASTTTLAPETAVYRSALNADGTFPTITDSGIPTAAAYYQFELELTVPSTVPSTITGPTGWTWLDGHGLPDPADLLGGETIYISVRLDCTARTFLASVWRVA